MYDVIKQKLSTINIIETNYLLIQSSFLYFVFTCLTHEVSVNFYIKSQLKFL